MRASTVLHATWQRARRPRTWGAALLFGLVWNGTRFALGWPEPGPAEMLAPTVWVALYLVLSPVPWQWTGGEAPMAGALRGALQALPWMGGLTLSVLLLLGGLAPPQPPGRPLRPGPPERMGPHRPHPGRAEEPHPLSIHPRLWALGVAHLCFGLLLGWILADRERAERIAAAAQRTAEEARGLALQGQMNPHVLFNAISGLTELVREDPEAAERALVSLSDLLRALMAHGSRSRAPLGDERRLVELHMALERLRLGHRLRERWDWPGNLDALEVPPLLVQPLVENALKHGVARAIGGGDLTVALRQEGGELVIRVANTGPAPIPGGTGRGLSNLRERLALLGLPDEAFSLRREGDWTVAELRLGVAP